MERNVQTPLDKSVLGQLRAGDWVQLSGTIYTARDAAHARMDAMLNAGQQLPIPLAGTAIYYAGPTPNRPGRPVGSLGPTTSGRMDAFAPRLLDLGLCAMIGKGIRNEAVKRAVVRNGAVYLAAMGGAGALLSQCVHAREVVAFEELQSEAVSRLLVKDFPCVVILDAHGGDLYEQGPQAYLENMARHRHT